MLIMATACTVYILCALIHCVCTTFAFQSDKFHDFTITTAKDLLSSGSVFIYSHPDITNYAHLVVDEERHQLILGARDYLLRLDLDSLRPIEVVEWKASNSTMSSCHAKGQSSIDCHNFVRVLVPHKQFIFACGTNAFSPQCSWREASQLAVVQEWVTGVARCPYHPSHNNSALMTADGNLYSATVTDFSGRDPAIYRIMGPSKTLRTIQRNSRWLNEPNFISTYELDDFIYFFFRETAVEFINCGKIIYSRVARVCKSDTGGRFLLDDNWSTFKKARLNCSLASDYPFYFNELQSTYHDPVNQLFYAIFTTPPTSIYGSALCVYNMSALRQSFEGAFKYQQNAQMAWSKMPNSAPNVQCSPTNVKRSLPYDLTAVQMTDTQKYQLMDKAVQPISERPLLVAENERFTHILVDLVAVKNYDHYVSVVFIATLEGHLKKVVSLAGSPCVVEELHLAEDGESTTVRSMKLIAEQGTLIIGTDDRVLRIPVHRCARFDSKLMCLNSQDPYCAWNKDLSKCTRLPSATSSGWLQNIYRCPVLDTPVVGGWSDWSPWILCQHTGGYRSGDKCICRSRSCDSPQPRFGGQHCAGISMEVTNCTQNGGWSDWSEWSACTHTCGAGTRVRHRRCTNPWPKFGGEQCDGEESQTEFCDLLAICNDDSELAVASGGMWSTWSEWTPCTAQCAGGVQVRRRLCNTAIGQLKGCIGNDQQWKTCNHHRCAEVRKVTGWSDWHRVNVTKSGYTEERTRYVCRASVLDPSLLHVSTAKVDVRFCSESGTDCIHPGFEETPVDGQWSRWSDWSECTVPCGGGTQWRQRTCSMPIPSGTGRDCQGPAEEAKQCHQHSCHGMWSCWSDFSHCSVSCGYGRKMRTRRCRAETPGTIYTEPCIGSSRDEVACQMSSCHDVRVTSHNGWSIWSEWSDCTHHNEIQERHRACHLSFPFTCTGKAKQHRNCDNHPGLRPVIEASQQAVHMSGFHGYHVAVAALLGFLMGAAVCIAVSLYWRRRVNTDVIKRQPMSTLPRRPVTENEYACPVDVDMKGAYRPLAGLDSRCYTGGGSLGRAHLTVREANLKRSSLLATGSLMRTKLELCDDDY